MGSQNSLTLSWRLLVSLSQNTMLEASVSVGGKGVCVQVCEDISYLLSSPVPANLYIITVQMVTGIIFKLDFLFPGRFHLT